MPIIHLPSPAAAHVADLGSTHDQVTIALATTSPAAHDALLELLQKAYKGGYSIEIKLIHYEGHADAAAQRVARKAERERKKAERERKKAEANGH